MNNIPLRFPSFPDLSRFHEIRVRSPRTFPLERRLAIVAGFMLLYVAAFAPAYNYRGPIVAALSIFPVCAVAWLFGLRAAGLAVLVDVIVLMGLFAIVGDNPIDAVLGRGLIGTFVTVAAGLIVGALSKLVDRLEVERMRADRVLYNALPHAIAAELIEDSPDIIAEEHEDVAVLFADIVDFTMLAAALPPTDVVKMLNSIFSHFDELTEQHGVEKIKTVGDAYMAVAGIPTPHPAPVQAVADLALAMQETIASVPSPNREQLHLRIGIHVGPVVAGVIGTKRISYDLWGDTVNIASRLEARSRSGGIHVSTPVFNRLHDAYTFERRGVIDIRGRGDIFTYYLLGNSRQ